MGCGCGCGGRKKTCGAVQSEFSGFEYVSGEMEGGQPQVSPPRASYRLINCTGGCAPMAADQCDATVRLAIQDAIAIANNAVRRLTPATLDDQTRSLFRTFMGHDPSLPIPWANNEQSRVSVAKRLRSCARELGGGRWTRYQCGCPGLPPDFVAWTRNPIEVWLCRSFWEASPQAGLPDRFYRAGVILHEMLHQLYIEFLLHNEREQRRNNANCYEALAMSLAGHVPDQAGVSQCH